MWFAEAHREKALADLVIAVRPHQIRPLVAGIGDPESVLPPVMPELTLYTPLGVAKGLTGFEDGQGNAIHVNEPERTVQSFGQRERDLVVETVVGVVPVDPERCDRIDKPRQVIPGSTVDLYPVLFRVEQPVLLLTAFRQRFEERHIHDVKHAWVTAVLILPLVL